MVTATASKSSRVRNGDKIVRRVVKNVEFNEETGLHEGFISLKGETFMVTRKPRSSVWTVVN